MHDDHKLVEVRLARAMDRINKALYRDNRPLQVQVWHLPGEPVPVSEALSATYEPFEVGTVWGPPWSTSWFKITGEVPAEWAGQKAELVFDIGFGGGPGFSSEGMAYTMDGTPIKAIHPRNRYVPVEPGQKVEILLEAAANPNTHDDTSVSDIQTTHHRPLFTFAQADAAILDENV
ncbi:MAG TPA: alpha-mannosidase, partial [Mycobacteriales bacterium]|nr:alpha-mannosidase [Mycobacteriales bacterium]